MLRLTRQKVVTTHKTLFVAASDASQEARESYDYLCDGIDDDKEINNALEALSRGMGRSGHYTDWRWRWPWEPATVYKKERSTGWVSNGSFMCSEYIEVPNDVRLEGEGMSKIYGQVRTHGSGTVKSLCGHLPPPASALPPEAMSQEPIRKEVEMEQETAKYKICPNCGKRMIRWITNTVPYPPRYPWKWRCGCGHTEPGGADLPRRDRTNDEFFQEAWESMQKSAQWKKVDLAQTVFLQDGKQYIAKIIGTPSFVDKRIQMTYMRMTEIEGINDNGEPILKG